MGLHKIEIPLRVGMEGVDSAVTSITSIDRRRETIVQNEHKGDFCHARGMTIVA